MDTHQRRALIETLPNPRSSPDYVMEVTEDIGEPDTHALRITLRLVPDKLIVQPRTLPGYLSALWETKTDSLEETAALLLEDLSDQAVPRWIEVRVAKALSRGVGEHAVVLEDCQPNWSNPSLLARLRPL